MSLYDGLPIATEDQARAECKRLQGAFPQTPPTVIAILLERIREKKIPILRLRDSVNNLIDNHRYPVPTIADVIGFDKKVKLYTHKEVVNSISEGYTFDHYEMVEINGEKRWKRK